MLATTCIESMSIVKSRIHITSEVYQIQQEIYTANTTINISNTLKIVKSSYNTICVAPQNNKGLGQRMNDTTMTYYYNMTQDKNI